MSKKTKSSQPFVKISDSVRSGIVAFVLKGASFSEAKKKFGVSAHTCSRIFHESGKKLPAAAPRKADAGKVAEKAVKASKKAKKPSADEVDPLA